MVCLVRVRLCMQGCENVIVMAETLNYLMALLEVRIFRFGLCAASVYVNTTCWFPLCENVFGRKIHCHEFGVDGKTLANSHE